MIKKQNNKKIQELSDRFLLSTYQRVPICFVKGRGVYLWDSQGKKYLDFVSGVAVNALGYAHPEIIKVIKEQSQSLMHVSNLFLIQEQAFLASKLCQMTRMQKAFFCNSGAEAIEACIKLARWYGAQQKTQKTHEIIATTNSFHGRTLGALSATGQSKYHEGMQPLLPGFVHVPYGDALAIKKAINDKTCAVLVEPIQGEGGVIVPPKGYLKEIRKICDQNNLLLILDEVQTGVGRTGRFMAWQKEKIRPDLAALAKGLGAGFPIGACLAAKRVSDLIRPGIHASTFGGNPLASAVALKAVTIISNSFFLKKVSQNGLYLISELNKLAKKFSLIKEIRGQGLLIGCELKEAQGAQIVAQCRKQGLLINCIHDTVLRLAPPLVISKPEIKQGIAILESVLEKG